MAHLYDFSGLSQGVKIYSQTDDYSGKYLTNPTVLEKYTGVTKGKVAIGKHVMIGSGSVVLPAVTIGEDSSIDAQSLVTKDIDTWGVFFGAPVRRLKNRSRNFLELEKEILLENL